MKTKIVELNAEDQQLLKKAAEVIKNDGTVVFPTETVYGLGANALSAAACEKIFIAKGRPQDNPLIVHVADFDIQDYVLEVPSLAQKLMEAFWPGPLTIIMKKSSRIPEIVTAGLPNVALRMPQGRTARKLIEYAGVPIAAPSANLSGRPSPTAMTHCIEDLDGRVDMIIGGESCEVGLESTVVDATGDKVVILRPGGVTKEMLEQVVGETLLDAGVQNQLSDGEKPRAPGMKYRHYAPKAPLVIILGEQENVMAEINRRIHECHQNSKRTGVLCTEEHVGFYKDSDCVISLGSLGTPGIIAANLFDCLREFDKMELDHLFSVGFEETGIGLAIMNRLKKAAGHQLIEV